MNVMWPGLNLSRHRHARIEA